MGENDIDAPNVWKILLFFTSSLYCSSTSVDLIMYLLKKYWPLILYCTNYFTFWVNQYYFHRLYEIIQGKLTKKVMRFYMFRNLLLRILYKLLNFLQLNSLYVHLNPFNILRILLSHIIECKWSPIKSVKFMLYEFWLFFSLFFL